MRYIVILFTIFLAACNDSKFDESKVRKEVLEITSNYNKTWETLDVQKIAEFHSDSSFLYYWHGSLASSNNKHFKELFPEILSSVKAWTIKKTSEPVVQVLSQDAAVISFTLEAESTMSDGKTTQEPGALTYVWKKENGKWKLVHIHDAPKLN